MGVPKPVRFVYYDDDAGMFRMDPEAVSILELLKGPIGVISVCGPTHKGKSYISNQLLGGTSGFAVAFTALSKCTKGLWLCSAPSRKTAADGTEYDVLVMDTEGINGCEQAEEYFYLAAVLSSMLIYNQMGPIMDCSIRHLSPVTKMANGDTTASDQLGHFSPTFVWLLRDYFMYDNGMPPSQYMESTLEAVNVPVHLNDDLIALNKVQKSIQALFPDRHCFTLVRPLIKEEQLQVLDQIPMNRLRPEFKKEMDEFRSFVFEKTKPKKIGGARATAVMTGPILLQVTEYILDAFNNSTWPKIAGILEKFGKTTPRKPLSKSAFTMAPLVGTPPAANTRKRKMMSSQKLAFMSM